MTADDGALIPNFIEESMRYWSISQDAMVRLAVEDLELGGVAVSKGDAVVISVPAGSSCSALYLQLGRGLSPLESGSVFLALGAGYFGASVVSSRKAASVTARRVAVGPLTLAIGYAAVALTADRLDTTGHVLWLLPALLVAGLGMGLTTGPLTNLVLGAAVPEHAASASGLLNTAQEGGAAVGVAIAGAVFFPTLADAGGSAGAYPHAFAVTLVPLIALGLLASALVLAAPGRTARH
ncbi:hypothetical protein SVIOM74S_09532 [Streptomyces violarus]